MRDSKDKDLTYYQKYYIKNKHKFRSYYDKNKDKIKAYAKRYYLMNKYKKIDEMLNFANKLKNL